MNRFTFQCVITLLLSFFFYQSGKAQCAPEIPGYINIGLMDGHNYYLSTFDATPGDAQAAAESFGGYLAVLSNAEEEAFVHRHLENLTYIGINDQGTEGNLQTVTGEPFVYNNINPCTFCQTNDDQNDFIVMEPWSNTPAWSFSSAFNTRRFLIEIPCGTSTTNCGFEIIQDNPFHNVGAHQSSVVTETATGYNIQDVRFIEFPMRKLVDWDIDFNGQNATLTDEDHVVDRNGLDFGRISTLGDYYFMHDVNDTEAILLKFDFNGNPIWTRNYSINGANANTVYMASRDAWEDNDGILVTGHFGTNPDTRTPFIIKTDLDGNEIWQKQLPLGNNFLSINVMGRSSDGGYYLQYWEGGASKIQYLKVSSTGDVVWTQDLGFLEEPGRDRIFVGESPDGNFLFYADQGINTGNLEATTYKLDANTGALVQEINLGDLIVPGSSENDFRVTGAVATNEGGLFVTFSEDVPDDFNLNTYYAKINAAGNVDWEFLFPRKYAFFFAATTAGLATSDGDFIISSGNRSSNMVVMKINGTNGWIAPLCDTNAPPPIVATCNDGIQNQGETGVDCGGPCTPCSMGGCNVAVSSSDGNIIITGMTTAENTKVFDANFGSVWDCNPWNGTPCSNSETVTGLTTGTTYFVSVQSDDCDEWIPVTIQGVGPTATCTDGIQNQGETGIDCGGPCAPCAMDGCNVAVSSSNGNIIITGLTAAENTKVFDANVSPVWECNPWNGSPCSNSETITGLTTGATYFVSVQSDNCEEWIPITVDGSGGSGGTCAINGMITNCTEANTGFFSYDLLVNGPVGGTYLVYLFDIGSGPFTTELTYNVTHSIGESGFSSPFKFVEDVADPTCNLQIPYDCNAIPTEITFGNCEDIVTTEGQSVTWSNPFCGGNCDGPCVTNQIAGPNNGDVLTAGTYTVTYEAQNVCGNTASCSFNITVNAQSGGCNVNATSANGTITVTGLTSAENTKLFNTSVSPVWECNPWNGSPCTNSETITGLTTGATYFLSVQSDNCEEWIPVTVQGNAGNLPDLTLANLAPLTGTPGQVVFFDFDLINLGAVSTGSYDITSYISTDGTISNDDVMEGNIATGNTAPGTQSGVVNAITIPNLQPGTYSFIMRADDNFEIAESNESNNTLTTTLTITSALSPSTGLEKNGNTNSSNKLKIAKVFPNPTTHEGFVVVESASNQAVAIEVYNAVGALQNQLATNIEIGNNVIELAVSDLKVGMYYVIIKDEKGQTVSSRFVKQVD